MPHDPLQILIVEDNHAAVHWLQIILSELHLNPMVSVVSDGEAAVNFILKRGRYFSAPEPDIIFLDLNLPKLSGIEVLAAVQNGHKYPVCVVSTSQEEREIVLRRFKLDARCYVIKPIDREHLLESFDCFQHLKPIADRIRSSPRYSQ